VNLIPRDRRLRDLAMLLGMALALAAAFFAFPDNLAFATRVIIMMIFVLSLDFVLGVAGISTLGHSALFGAGAYAAGLCAAHGWNEPLLGVIAGAAAAAFVALLSGLFLMRTRGLTLLMLTIAVTEVLGELANKFSDITGGADGLDIVMGPILGVFKFDFRGQVGFVYAACVLLVVFAFLRILLASPFGLAARGVKESPARMRAIGAPVYWRLVLIYAIGGALAGIAGALSAQSTSLVSPAVFDFQLSANALIMLILGGAGRLYGALFGTLVFMSVHEVAASVDPFNWLFIIGALLLAVVYVAPAGLLSLPDLVKRQLRFSR
jgi:branched-chain amino acid transport system permease protein